MNVYHPLNSIPKGAATWITFAALLAFSIVLGILAGPNLGPPGSAHRRIIALEMPADEADADAVIKEWGEAKRLDAVRQSIWWDNLFILAYTTLTALGCVIVARAFFAEGSPEYKAALLIAWLPWLAGLFDYVENYAMLRMLGGFSGDTLPNLARRSSTTKFAIILPLAAWVLVSLVLLGLKYLIGRWK